MDDQQSGTGADPAGYLYADLVKEELAREQARKTSLEQRGLSVISTSGALVSLLFALLAFVENAGHLVIPPVGRLVLIPGL
jgi:hypothetical protein